MSRLSTAFGAAVLIAAASAEDLPDHVLKLAAVRRNMKTALAELPNYACLATVERSQRRTAQDPFQRVDVLNIEVAYIQGKEFYSWPGGGKFQVVALGDLVGTGMSSTGAFASHAHDILVSGAAIISFRGPEPVGGRRLLRWDFAMPSFLEDYTVQAGGQTAKASSQGSFWADSQSLDVVRLDVRVGELAPDFPIASTCTTIDFARMRLGLRNILLPQSSTTTLVELGGREKRNITDFSHCRQFAADSVVNFDAPHAAPQPASARDEDTDAAEVFLPPGIRLSLVLKSPVESDSCAVGTPLAAEITSDAISRGQVVVPRGAIVRGRLRQLDYEAEPAPHFTVGLEFNEIEFPGGKAMFFGELETIASVVPGLRLVFSSLKERRSFTPSGVLTTTTGWEQRVREVPGVGAFFIEGTSFRLPEGTAMIWRTSVPKR